MRAGAPRFVVEVLLAASVLVAGSLPSAAIAAECPDRVDESAFATSGRLRSLNKVMADAGERPTASPAHHRYIRWLESSLRSIDGVDVKRRYETIDRWLSRGARLGLVEDGGKRESIRISGPVPYSRPATVRGPLVYIPPGTAISASDVEGKIVLRDAVPAATPQAIFFAVAYYVHDPDLSLNYTGNYERDFSAYQQRVTDLKEAAQKGAKGVVFAHTIPHNQGRGNYQPYEGVHWDVPAVFVGVDEGDRLKKASSATVDMTVRARRDIVPSPTLIATLPGGSSERIVLASHTDGMNAIWDNGPTSILALADYLASLPLSCRPRTFEFVLSTAHLYLAENGAHNYAHDELDPGYDEGTVAFVVALEHLGAKEFVYRARGQGLPGFELHSTGASEPFVTFSHESPASLGALLSSVVDRDLRRSWILRGADAPQLGFPPHKSYGGEGGAYHQALVPTLAGITGPNTLYNPAFTMDQLVDFPLMRKQTMAFGDVALKLQGVPREVIAGADTIYREGRDLTQ